MYLLKKIIVFLVISFKLLLYIVNTTISNNYLIVYLYLIIVTLLAFKYIIRIKFNKESFIKTMIIMVISFVMFFLYKDDNIFLYAILGLVLVGEDNKDIVKTIFISLIIIFLLTIILGMLKVLPITESYRTIEGEAQIRNSLGFPNANAAFAYFIPIVLSGVYLFKKDWKFNIISLISAIAIYNFTKCRTGFYLVLIILGFNFLKRKEINYKFAKKSFGLFFIISVLLAFFYGTTKYNGINELLSFRPWYSYQFLKQGIFIWGHGIPDNLILDNLYLKLLANYSVVGLFLYYYIYMCGSKFCLKNRELLFSMIFFNVYNIFEAMTIGNFVLIVLLKELFSSYEVDYEKN